MEADQKTELNTEELTSRLDLDGEEREPDQIRHTCNDNKSPEADGNGTPMENIVEQRPKTPQLEFFKLPDKEPFPIREEPDGSEGDTENEVGIPLPSSSNLNSSFDDFCDFRSILPPDKLMEESGTHCNLETAAFESNFVATFPETQTTGFLSQTNVITTVAQGQIQSNDDGDDDDDDDFGDFSEAPTMTFQTSTSKEPGQLPAPDLSKFTDILSYMFPNNVSSSDNAINEDTTLDACEILKQMKGIETSQALKFKYLNSKSSLVLMDSIGIDSRNVVRY